MSDETTSERHSRLERFATGFAAVADALDGAAASTSVDDWLGIYSEHSHEHADQIRRARRGED